MAKDETTALIMAAGQGTRMRSAWPKVLHEVCGRPMIAWPVRAARAAGATRIAVIVSPGADLAAALPEDTETVVQPEADGTGGAIRAAAELIRESGTVIVLSGDTPLLDADGIASLLAAHRQAGAAATMMTTKLDDPGAFGRVIRAANGQIEGIVEAKEPGDATAEQLAIREVNVGAYVFEAASLADALGRLGNANAQGEYYLPDVLPLIREDGGSVVAHLVADAAACLGVNDRADLARVTAEAQRRILLAHMQAGVTVVDPATTWIDADVELSPDVRLEPGTSLRGRTSVGSGSVIGPMTTVIDSRLGREVSAPHSYLVECEVAAGASIGPFAYLRPAARLGQGSRAGAFVEIKNSEIGAGAKVPHLSYIGDADIGENANLGAGTITANYDGFRKHRTKVGRDARVGVDTALVAPVEIGDGAFTGAGSVISRDVPEGSLGVTRAEQLEVKGYAERKAAERTDPASSGDPADQVDDD